MAAWAGTAIWALRPIEEIRVPPGTDTLKNAMSQITDTKKVFRFVLESGTYNEIQIELPRRSQAAILIEGAGVGNTIINTDGLRTDVDPESGERYVDMDEVDKHGLAARSGFSIRDLTWDANDVKYCIHDDFGRLQSKVYAENVHFIMDNHYCIGVGMSAGADGEYYRCSFTTSTVHYGFFIHNTLIMSNGSNYLLEDCTFNGVGVLIVKEWGPPITNHIRVVNCTTDREDATRGIYLTAGSEPLPYTFRIIQEGGTMPAFAFDEELRPNAEDYFELMA